jgi:hypothetical protein
LEIRAINPNGANRKRFACNFRLLDGALLLAMLLGVGTSAIETSAAQSEPADQRLTQPAFDRQIERVLQNPEYNWREKDHSDKSLPGEKKSSIVEQWMGSIRETLLSLGSWVRDLVKWLFKPFDPKIPMDQPAVLRPFGWLNALGYLLWAAFAGTLILFLLRILKLKATKLPSSIAPLPKPDLASEEVTADQLPDNEWAALAREKVASGEFRQAQRALFLAILSYLASHRLIVVERWKSNTDYEKELGHKSKRLSELPTLFAQSRLGFERCWYGANNVTLEDFQNYNTIYERIKHASD